MATQFEATLRLKGSDETAEAFRSAAEHARRFTRETQDQSRTVQEDVQSVGRAFRGLRRTLGVGGAVGLLKAAISEVTDYNEALTRIGINAGASEETLRTIVTPSLRAQAQRINVDVLEVAKGFDAWRVASGQSLQAALTTFPQVATAAQALGTSVETVGTMAGRLTTNLKIDPTDMMRSFDMITVASRNLGVPFETFAQNLEGYTTQMETLGLTGVDGLQQVLGMFTSIQATTNDTGRSFQILGDLMNKAVDPSFLGERFRKAFFGQIQQSGGNVIDVLGRIMTAGRNTDQAWQDSQVALTKLFGEESYKLISRVRDGTISVKDGTEALRNSLGATEQQAARAGEAQAKSLVPLVNSLRDILRSLGEVALAVDSAFGSEKQGFIKQTAEQLSALAGIISNITQGNWQKVGEAVAPRFFGPEAEQRGVGESLKQGVAEATQEATSGFTEKLDAIYNWFNPQGYTPAAVAGRQRGGPVESGQPFVVGERGPELFVPDINGRVVPNWQPQRTAAAAATRAMPGAARAPVADDTAIIEATDATSTNTGAVEDATREQQRLNELIAQLNVILTRQMAEQRVPPALAAEAQFPKTRAGAGAPGAPRAGGLFGGMEPPQPLAAPPGAAKSVAESYLGRAISEQEYNVLMRTTHAEAGAQSSPAEQAMIMATILNRARPGSGFPGAGSITGVVTAPSQFQAVTGTRAAPGTSAAFRRGPSETRQAGIEASVAAYLQRVPPTQQRFTATDPRAYGPGTNIGYLGRLQRTGGAAYGGTQFETQLQPEPRAAAAAPPAEAPLSSLFDQGALDQARAARAELAQPIPIRFQAQPGETQMRRNRIRNEMNREVREAGWSSYADVGLG